MVPGGVPCSFISGRYYCAASHTYGMHLLIIIFTIILMTIMMIKYIKVNLRRSFSRQQALWEPQTGSCQSDLTTWYLH